MLTLSPDGTLVDILPMLGVLLGMSVVFFGVGRFESVQDAEDGRVRLLTPPGGTQFSAPGLKWGRQALAFCESYFGIPYPLDKMDLISIPDFAFGAMENWGAVTFRENLLLNYPGVTSKAGQERIFEVIAHEITHQWFGNLVTPSDWRYLWLNESFATYFGFGIVDHYQPEWEIWSQFILTQTDAALRRDGLQETFPIEIPGGEHLVINTSTAPIIYSKGGSVLRQIRGFIGDDAFLKGLRDYLSRHAYACAGSLQFWEAFETVSDQPVSEIMRAWDKKVFVGGNIGTPLVDQVLDYGPEDIIVLELSSFQLMTMGVMATVNQTIDYDTAVLVAAEFGYEVEKASFEEDVILKKTDADDPDKRAAPVAGEIFRQPDLLATLKKLVDAERAALAEGKSRKQAIYAAYDRFYRGDIAEEFVRGCQEQGGLITLEDLDQWEVYVEKPVMTTYKGIEVYKLNTWVQGPVMLQALNMLEEIDLKSMGYNTSRYIHALYQVMNHVYAAPRVRAPSPAGHRLGLQGDQAPVARGDRL